MLLQNEPVCFSLPFSVVTAYTPHMCCKYKNNATECKAIELQICNHFSSLKRKGRPKKANHHNTMLLHKAITGCTPTPSTIPKHIKDSPLPRKDIECPICCNVLCQPIQLDCGAIVCSSCCHQWVETATQPSCPCCHKGHPFSPASIRPAPDMVMSVLESLIITCSKCNSKLQSGQHRRHLESGCKDCVLPSESEEKIASGFIRRMLSNSPDGSTISIPPPTSGKVHKHCNCT